MSTRRKIPQKIIEINEMKSIFQRATSSMEFRGADLKTLWNALNERALGGRIAVYGRVKSAIGSTQFFRSDEVIKTAEEIGLSGTEVRRTSYNSTSYISNRGIPVITEALKHATDFTPSVKTGKLQLINDPFKKGDFKAGI